MRRNPDPAAMLAAHTSTLAKRQAAAKAAAEKAERAAKAAARGN